MIIAAHKARGEKVQMIDSTSVWFTNKLPPKNKVETFVSVTCAGD